MRELLIALSVVLGILFIGTTCVKVGNAREPVKQGPTYILPDNHKPKHIVRIKCKWVNGKLKCGPAIGTKWFEEWEWWK
jgi:hypothetical protein